MSKKNGKNPSLSLLLHSPLYPSFLSYFSASFSIVSKFPFLLHATMNGGSDVSSSSKGWITTKNDSDQNGAELSRWSLHNRTEWWINDFRFSLLLPLVRLSLSLSWSVVLQSQLWKRMKKRKRNPDKQSSSKVTSFTDFLLVSLLLRLLIFMTMASSSMIINNKTVGLKLEGKKGWNEMQVRRRDEKSDEISNSILILFLLSQ